MLLFMAAQIVHLIHIQHIDHVQRAGAKHQRIQQGDVVGQHYCMSNCNMLH